MTGNMDASAGQPVGPAPDRAEVLRALDGVLASGMFRGSAKVGAFLRYVVEARSGLRRAGGVAGGGDFPLRASRRAGGGRGGGRGGRARHDRVDLRIDPI